MSNHTTSKVPLGSLEFPDGDRRVVVDFDKGLVEFYNLRVETFLPKKTSNFVVGFDEIGRNSLNPIVRLTQTMQEDFHMQRTSRGNVWIPVRYKQVDDILSILADIYVENINLMTKQERKEFDSAMVQTHPKTLILGPLLLLGFAGPILYYAYRVFTHG